MAETLELGSTRSRGAGLVVSAVLGVACGAGATAWWSDRQAADQDSEAVAPAMSASSDVRLVLTGVRPPAHAGDVPLIIEGVLLHDRGEGRVTVTDISRPGRAVDIETPVLPVTLSVNRSFERIRLKISPRDCALATEWTPSSQPFAVTWEDEAGAVRTELGGDHDAALEIAMTGFMDAACRDVGR